MSICQAGDWAAPFRQRLRLREARYERGGDWVAERREGLLFLHVAKSGGTSLDAFFSSFFPADRMLPAALQHRRMVEWNPEDWRKYEYFKLEWPYELTAKISPPLHAVTLLRDPVQRIISQYKHLRRADDHSQQYDAVRARRTPEQEAARNLSLAEWARLEPPDPGAYFRHPYLGMATIGVRNLVDKTEAELDALLIRARQNLREKFAFVGIVEEYLASKRLFCQTFGIPLHYSAGEERLNVAPEQSGGKSPPDAETIALLRRDNRWDVELYEFARELFTARRRTLDARRDLLLDGSDLAAPPLESRPRQGAAEHPIDTLPGSGLYPAEISPLGMPVRWTGCLPSTTLDLICAWPARGPLDLYLEIVAVVEPERLGELQVQLDGRPPRSIRWEPTPHGTRMVLRFDLSAEIAARNCHQLAITGPTATPPAAPGEPPDPRRLGIGLSHVAWTWGGAARPLAESVTPRRAAS